MKKNNFCPKKEGDGFMFLYNFFEDDGNTESILLLISDMDGSSELFLNEADKIINEISRSYNFIISKTSQVNVYKVYESHADDLDDCLHGHDSFTKDCFLELPQSIK